MSKSNQLYPNSIHTYAIQQFFSGNAFKCIDDHGYQSNNAIMNWWTHENKNKPLADHAKLFGFYEDIKSIFKHAHANMGESVNCYNIHYISKKVMLPLADNGMFNIGVYKNETIPVVYTEANTLTMVLAPSVSDFVPILITVYSGNEEHEVFESIDNVSLFASHLVF